MSTPSATIEKLAVDGGAPAVTCLVTPQKRWGDAELHQLQEMLEQPSLFYWNGPQTKLLVERFKEYYPLEYVMPCSSGTGAIHIAVAAAGIRAGDEIIMPPITDMGSVIGVLYQQGVAVFADLEPHTYNLDPQSVREKITPRTKAILAVHLFGNPCNLTELKAICDEHDLILIEDCAQAWGTMYGSTPVGMTGDIGCWSLNDYKHIGCGDGGIVASSDERFGPLLQKFGDKAYDRGGGPRMPNVLAPNYRISEPQSAVAAAQMAKMWDITEKRAVIARTISQLLEDVPGIHPPAVRSEDRFTVFSYTFRIDPAVLSCNVGLFAEALQAEGLMAGAGYIGVPIYKYPMFQNHNFFGGGWPIKEFGLTDMEYTKVCCSQAEAILETCISFAVNEAATEEWARQAARAIRKVAAHYAR